MGVVGALHQEGKSDGRKGKEARGERCVGGDNLFIISNSYHLFIR